MKVSPVETDGVITGYAFDCPGCKSMHYVTVKPYKNSVGASWSFNGKLDSPSFSPSILQTVERTDGSKKMICHSFVTDGKIQFLSDCTHGLAGQTVELPESTF